MAKGKKTQVRISERMKALMDGTLSMDDLDDEEVQRGQLRADDGTFRGRPPDYVPRKFHDLLVREQLARWQAKVNAELIPALNVLKEISENKRAPADARYKSAVYLIERAAGKIPDKTEMKVELAKWEQDIDGLFYEDEGDKK